MMNEHTSLEKYTSHTLFKMVGKGCVWEVSWRLNRLQHTDPQVPLSLAALFSHSAGPSLGAGSHCNLNFNCNWLQLTEPVCGTGLYNCLIPTCFLWASHLHPIQPVHSHGYTLISSTGCTCYLHTWISYLTAWPRVNMQQVEKGNFKIDQWQYYRDNQLYTWRPLNKPLKLY